MIKFNKIEYLRKRLEKNCNFYVGEMTNDKLEFVELAKLFHIPIDSSRLSDYVVKSINYKVPLITVVDKKNDITYSAKCTNYSSVVYGGDSVDFVTCNIKFTPSFHDFVSLSVDGYDYSLMSLYRADSEIPIISELTFYDDNNQKLTFVKETKDSGNLFENSGDKFLVSYSKDIETGPNCFSNQKLLTKVYEKDSKNIKNYEPLVNTGSDYYIARASMDGNYIYTQQEGNAVYGISKTTNNTLDDSFCGVCIENMSIDFKRYFPTNMNVSDYPKLFDKNTQSAMIFNGKTESTQNHSLEIYKYDDCISVKYVENTNGGKDNNKSLNLRFDTDEKGKITASELAKIILVIDERIEDNDFITAAKNGLKVFSEMTDNNVNETEKLDPLSPKVLSDKSFDEIFKMVLGNLYDYFALAEEQFSASCIMPDANEKEFY